MAVERKIYGN
ncbi:hypothetical protein PIIN_11238 [Serendipita indica DSM 11827]|uniref:Uncharacterized protein n=1 Tax=Serendipita indica (strain DSM 11827) TaxID=1109443 RepID=G4U117_SERID|nr:hypothetical protein PIIN_11232 [Serendipita indica DSM 11827]CCA77260.1 hypothetical protein PIIN_11238 [Serendipita indica DSM 11827]